MNRAHGGKKTDLSELILNSSNIIGKTLHFEEGARFWRKPNKNLIIFEKHSRRKSKRWSENPASQDSQGWKLKNTRATLAITI